MTTVALLFLGQESQMLCKWTLFCRACSNFMWSLFPQAVARWMKFKICMQYFDMHVAELGCNLKYAVSINTRRQEIEIDIHWHCTTHSDAIVTVWPFKACLVKSYLIHNLFCDKCRGSQLSSYRGYSSFVHNSSVEVKWLLGLWMHQYFHRYDWWS